MQMMQQLIARGLLEPGPHSLTITYQGYHFQAAVHANGIIEYQGTAAPLTMCCMPLNNTGQAFETPSGWALFVMRSVNPARKAVDGWKAVRHRGEVLSTLVAKLSAMDTAASTAAHAAMVAACMAAGGTSDVSPVSAALKPPTPPSQPTPRRVRDESESTSQQGGRRRKRRRPVRG